MYNQENCKFASTHEWAYIENGVATVGISDHAQHEISDIVFVELPKVGTKVEQGKSCCVIESVKSASDIYAPFSGEIIEVNQEAADNPSIVNQVPHGDGWLFKIKIANPDEVKNLLSFDEYKAKI